MKWKCSDLKCVRKPTRSRLSLSQCTFASCTLGLPLLLGLLCGVCVRFRTLLGTDGLERGCLSLCREGWGGDGGDGDWFRMLWMLWLLYCSCLIRVLGNEWANDLVSLSYGYECANLQSECVWLSLENRKMKNQKNYKIQNQQKTVCLWMICRYPLLVVWLCEWSSALGGLSSVCLGLDFLSCRCECSCLFLL